MIKRAIIQRVQEHNLAKFPIHDAFYKVFIVLSKDRVWEIDKKIANFTKKDTIKYIQEEFEKSWKRFNDKLYTRHW